MTAAWLDEAREVKKLARKNGSPEIYLQPIYSGKKLCLEYREMKLRIKGLTKNTITLLKRSGVPRFLFNDTYARWGGHYPDVLFVHGIIVRSRKDKSVRRFLPLYVCGKDGIEYHNQITTMHLLFARGFYTPITQSSWMHTTEIKPATLQKRLDHKALNRLETKDGKAFPVVAPVGLELFDCMGWKSTAPKVKKK